MGVKWVWGLHSALGSPWISIYPWNRGLSPHPVPTTRAQSVHGFSCDSFFLLLLCGRKALPLRWVLTICYVPRMVHDASLFYASFLGLLCFSGTLALPQWVWTCLPHQRLIWICWHYSFWVLPTRVAPAWDCNQTEQASAKLLRLSSLPLTGDPISIQFLPLLSLFLWL